MEKILKKHLRITISLSLLVIFVLAGLWYFSMRMKEREERVREVKQSLSSYELNKKTFIDESSELEEIEKKVSDLESLKVSVEQVPQLLSMLEGLGRDNGVSFTITSVETPKEDNSEEVLAVEFSAGGTYEKVASLLNDLMHQPYQIKFTSFSFFKNSIVQGARQTEERPPWELFARIEIISF